MLGVWTGFIERKKENETHSHMFLYTCECDDVVWSCAMQWMNMSINTSNDNLFCRGIQGTQVVKCVYPYTSSFATIDLWI